MALILLPWSPARLFSPSHARSCEVRHEEATRNYEKLEANVNDSHDALCRDGQRVRAKGTETATAEGRPAQGGCRAEAGSPTQ